MPVKKWLTKFEKKQERTIASLKRRGARLRSESNGDKIQAAGMAMGGGAIAGTLNAYTDDLGGVVPISALVGIGLVLFGASGKKKIHNAAAMIGSGALSKVAGDFAEDGIEAMKGAPALTEAAV